MNEETRPRRARPRLHPIWLLLLPFALFIAVREFSVKQPAQAVYCSEQTPPAANQVTMLSAAWCRYCTKARNWLVERNVPYCEYDIERSATGAARYAAGQVKAIPQIFIADRLIVGFDEEALEQTLAARVRPEGKR